MDFAAVTRDVFALYESGRYDDALELVEGARPDHANQDGRLTFWEACLLGVSDRPEEALRVLERGLERGLWWASYRLSDTDLDSLRELPDWEDVTHRSEEAAATFMMDHPARPQVRPASSASPAGTLITLHGAGADPIAHFERRSDAAPDAWTVIAPSGTVPVSDTDRAWPRAASTGVVIDQIGELDYPAPVAVAGYSQGAGVAAVLAWERHLDTAGLILVAPSLRPEPWDPETDAGVRTFMVVGEHDSSLSSCIELQRRLDDAGVPVVLDQHDDLGHHEPAALKQVVTSALDWITS